MRVTRHSFLILDHLELQPPHDFASIGRESSHNLIPDFFVSQDANPSDSQCSGPELLTELALISLFVTRDTPLLVHPSSLLISSFRLSFN